MSEVEFRFSLDSPHVKVKNVESRFDGLMLILTSQKLRWDFAGLQKVSLNLKIWLTEWLKAAHFQKLNNIAEAKHSGAFIRGGHGRPFSC